MKAPQAKWLGCTMKGMKMMRGLSKWQRPVLTAADRGGARLFLRLPDRTATTSARAMVPLVPCDALPCSDGAKGYAKLAASSGIEHGVAGSTPGTPAIAGGDHIGGDHIQTANTVRARRNDVLKPFCGPAMKTLNSHMRRLAARFAGMRPADIIPAPQRRGCGSKPSASTP